MAQGNLIIGENDHIPPDFTLEQLKASLGMDEEEALRMTTGDDPMFTAEQVAKAFPKEEAQPENQLDAIGAPVAAVEQAKVAAPAPVAPSVEAPVSTAPPQQLVTPDLTEAQKVIAGSMSAIEALNSKFDDGDMTRAEWTAAIAAQTDAVTNAKAQVMQAQAATESYRNSFIKQWQPVISAFEAQHAHLTGPNVDSVVHKAWDNALTQVNTDPQYAHLGLQARAELVYDVLGPQLRAIGKVFPERQAQPAAAAIASATGPRTDARPEAMQTLAGLANASLPPVNDSTFAAIDTLDPEAAEAAMARMTPEQMDKYLYTYGGGFYGTEG